MSIFGYELKSETIAFLIVALVCMGVAAIIYLIIKSAGKKVDIQFELHKDDFDFELDEDEDENLLSVDWTKKIEKNAILENQMDNMQSNEYDYSFNDNVDVSKDVNSYNYKYSSNNDVELLDDSFNTNNTELVDLIVNGKKYIFYAGNNRLIQNEQLVISVNNREYNAIVIKPNYSVDLNSITFKPLDLNIVRRNN